jgi:4,5-DOPA dioxygenase extradiol
MERLPAIFFGHGNPMNALGDNAFTQAWRRFGADVVRPRAVLAISAHWFVPDVGVTVSTSPRTIHDFAGFPSELFAVQYPAPGDPELARRVQALLAPVPVRLDVEWGLDHGTWSVLTHVFPAADVPVVQVSIDARQEPAFHYELGRKLAPLRDEGVLIVGSGNVVHNLRRYMWGLAGADAYAWAERFEREIRDLISGGDERKAVDYRRLGADALLSVPTPDHYLPLLYVLGARQSTDPARFPVEGIEGGSISMLAVQVG